MVTARRFHSLPVRVLVPAEGAKIDVGHVTSGLAMDWRAPAVRLRAIAATSGVEAPMNRSNAKASAIGSVTG